MSLSFLPALLYCGNLKVQSLAIVGVLHYRCWEEHQQQCKADGRTPSINLGSGPYSVPKTESSGIITSANLLGDVQILFDAKTLVDLVPGFFVANGRAFHAYIDGCGNSFSSAQYTKSTKSSGIHQEVLDQENNILTVNSLQVYPNPANKKIDVRYQLTQEATATFSLYNLQGIMVYQSKAERRLAGVFHVSIDVSKFAAGTYLLKYQSNNEIKTIKVVVIH